MASVIAAQLVPSSTYPPSRKLWRCALMFWWGGLDPAPVNAVTSIISLRERFWRRIGYRYHLGDEPEGADALAGWVRTDTRLHFGWCDRLRLLLTGKLLVVSIVRMDVPLPTVCKSRMDWRIV